MGYCITHPDPLVGFERRRESVRIFEHYEGYPPQFKHIFAYGDGSVEMSKEMLARVLAFFDNPDNRKLCGLEVPPPLPTGE